jgi:Zn finger protein HypA/HybF involved in hydrogenase expression
MQEIQCLTSIIDNLLRQSTHAASVSIAVGELIIFNEEEIHAQWSQLVSDTPLAQSRLTIRRILAEQQCMVCFEKYRPLDKETSCPQCGSVGAKILAGEECYLESIE